MASGPAKKILVVDDEVKMCAVVKKYLEFLEYEVDVAYDGDQALTKARDSNPSCILLDVRMPILSGYEVLKTLKSEMHESEIIMTTAVSSMDLAEECIKQGAYGYLMKPIKFDDLGKMIQEALSKRQTGPKLSGS